MSERHCTYLPCVIAASGRERAVQTPKTAVVSSSSQTWCIELLWKEILVYSIKRCLYLLIASKLAEVLSL